MACSVLSHLPSLCTFERVGAAGSLPSATIPEFGHSAGHPRRPARLPPFPVTPERAARRVAPPANRLSFANPRDPGRHQISTPTRDPAQALPSIAAFLLRTPAKSRASGCATQATQIRRLPSVSHRDIGLHQDAGYFFGFAETVHVVVLRNDSTWVASARGGACQDSPAKPLT